MFTFTNPYVLVLNNPEARLRLSVEGREALDKIYEGRVMANAVAKRMAHITNGTVRVVHYETWAKECEDAYERSLEERASGPMDVWIGTEV